MITIHMMTVSIENNRDHRIRPPERLRLRFGLRFGLEDRVEV
jgi:hypothetical protein